MAAIKSLVIGLGILIIAGLILLGYAFYARTTDPEFRIMKEQRQQAADSRASRRADEGLGAGFGEVDFALPEGCSVVEMKPDGKWLYLRIGPAGACERIVVFDPLTGRQHGAIVPAP